MAIGAALDVRTNTVAVGGAYALQGVGYAVVVTALPAFKATLGLDDMMVSIILLGVCVTAAAGSVLADLVAVRRNSRTALLVGFLIQLSAILVVALVPMLTVFIIAVLAYGLGLGMVDAASNMQGVLLQRRRGTPILGRLYTAYTVGAILGALSMSGATLVGGGAPLALVVAAVLQAALVRFAWRRLDDARAARAARDAAATRAPLHRRAILVVGLVVFAAFTVDSTVSSWSTVYLTGLGAAAVLAPLGYAAYQGGVLVMRLITDAGTRRFGSRTVLASALALGVAGGLLVVLVPGPIAAIVGFALSGLAVGALVPIAFGLAGRIDPARSDEVVARVNLFNYGGAVFGAVGAGLVIEDGGGLAFLIPALLLLVAIPALRAARVETGIEGRR